MTVIRAAGLADVDDYRRLQAAVFPYQVTTAAGVAYRWRRDDADPRAHHGLFAADSGGRVVG
ncbi:MAG TPA: hypothetical protein VFY17_06710, partial [Pilimelia sp.]|nr:hypothetical protein [Pilimelia sp.]